MRKTSAVLAISLALLAVTVSSAQCNRGGRSGGTSTESYSPGLTSNNGFAESAYSPFAVQLQMQRAQQQQYQFAMQQRMRQANLQRQRDNSDRANSQFASSTNSSRFLQRERLRLQNAEKALAKAQRAEVRGQLATAEKSFQKVIRILGEDHELAQRATNALLAVQRKNDPTESVLLAVLDR